MPFFDEMFLNTGHPRDPYDGFSEWFAREDPKKLKAKQREAKNIFRNIGITFNVYDDDEPEERLIPFDFIPRILSKNEWENISLGIEQRVRAINDFLNDVYNHQEILKAGIIPENMLAQNKAFLPQMIGMTPPGGIFTHIVGIDLVRTGANEFFVLEDNVRTPSGVSYMLENRETMLNMFPELFLENKIQPVSQYPETLYRALIECQPPNPSCVEISVAVLTPGIYNAAYFEHSFLADKMSVPLVQSNDLRTRGGRLVMRTTRGFKPIDVLYRRVDDSFIDPLNFDPHSRLGVAGLFDVYRAGRLSIINAPGSGIADDKAIYSYMSEIIQFYSGEIPLLKNVKTWRCGDPKSLEYVLDNIEQLVVKEVHGSGGHGMLVGPAATRSQIRSMSKRLRSRPSDYIAQPTLALSTVPIFSQRGLAPRHVDLRPFVLVSPLGVKIIPGGLTRVALNKGSLVVNSSQGGGTKDTWVLES